VDDQAIRAAAILAAALAHGGQITPQSDLTAYADGLVPWITGTPAPAPAHLTVTIKGDPMPLTVDSENAVAVLEFADRDNDRVAPPAGTVATATSSDPAVLTVGAARPGTGTGGVATIEFPLTEAGAGTATLSVHATAADGSPLLGPDGTTPIPDPDPVPVTVNPGAAASERFTVPGA
jgi:hypothetical protein